jgi:hypothetical protein
MFELPIATGFYKHEILPLSCQTCVNWIPIKAEAGALSTSALLDRWGLEQFAELAGEFRCATEFQGVYLTVKGQTLYSVDSGGNSTSKGTIGGTGRVSVAYNDDYAVFVVNNGGGYFFDGSTVTEITDADYLPASSVAFVDGYFVFSALDGSRFFCSAVNDPSSYSSLDRSTAEERPDPIVCVFVFGNLLHVAGTQTIERHNNIGGVSFPFQRINQATLNVGVYGVHTVKVTGEGVLFIGGGVNEGAQVYFLSGGQPQVVSTTAIDKVIQSLPSADLEQAFTFYFQKDGQSIYGFTIESFTAQDRTFCINTTSGEWFELSSDGGAWYGRDVTRIYNKYIVGDNSRIGMLSDSNNDYGVPVLREKTSQPFINNNGDGFRIGRIEAWFQAGTGSASIDPQVMMDFSDDLGFTWSNPVWVGIGKVGQYGKRAEWRRQGYVSRNRVYRFKASDDFKFNFLKLTAA